MNPYVVTLALDDLSQARFDDLRTTWFPPGRTQVGAHVTLFHAVPADVDVEPDLGTATDRASYDVQVSRVVPLGSGVAFALESAQLSDTHGLLQRRWHDRLTRQDQQGFRPHVTVQNKVAPEVAHATLAQLSADFTPYDVHALGLDLWRYDGGPWTHLRRFDFQP